MRYRALLAAIDNYGHPRNNLPSCLEDLRFVQHLLSNKLGVPADKIKALTDGEATVEAVHNGLKWLTSDTAEDERLLFFYSGHGFQIPTTDNGGKLNIEEGLVLTQDKFFYDNELVKASQAAPPGTLTLLFDCCFGGGGDKVFSPTGGQFGSYITPKRWAPPTEFITKHEVLNNPNATPVASYKPFGMLPITVRPPPSLVMSASESTTWPTAIDEEGQPLINGALLAACHEDETASASNDLTDGLSAFTCALKRLIEQRGLDQSLQEVRDGTDRILKAMRFRQTSTLKIGTGPIDRDSRFLGLQRKPTVPSRPTDRRVPVADDKFLEMIAPIIIERVINELTKKGYTPRTGGDEKFFPGFETLVPILVNRAIDELTKKGYQPVNSGSDKSVGGDIFRELVNRITRELVNKGYTPVGTQTDKFFPGIEVIAPIVIDRVIDQFVR